MIAVIKNLVATIVFVSFCCENINAQNVHVTITNLRSKEGKVHLSLFLDNESFRDETPIITKIFEKSNVVNGELVVNFSLEPGTYAMALLDDENGDGEMNYNFLGMPREGFGFSNYEHKGLSKPHFDDFKFVLEDFKKITIVATYIL